MKSSEIIARLESLSDRDAAAGMARFGILANKVYGVKIPILRALAKEAGRDHDLARELWKVNSRETRILASMIDAPSSLTEQQMESWAADFDSWELCDQCIMNLFEKNSMAWGKAVEWSERKDKFVKRAGFVLMARLAVSDKKADDGRYEAFLPIIIRESRDKRNFVRKAVNWALRQIGKRNMALHGKAIETARQILSIEESCAHWVASDALKELESEAVVGRLKMKETKEFNH